MVTAEKSTPSPTLKGRPPAGDGPIGPRVLAAAERIIARDGLTGLKARDVAAAVGCSVGSVYNSYADLDALVLAANRGTLLRLDAALDRASACAAPGRILHALASAYLAFAIAETRALRALFEHRMEDDRPFSRENLALVEASFSRIAAPLAGLLPDVDPERVAMLARTLFSAVHGIIALGLEERLVAVPVRDLEGQIALFVDAFETGLDVYRVGVAGWAAT